LDDCRRIARELVEKWSRPIFDQYREQDAEELRRVREDEFAKARQRRQQKEAKAAPAVAPGVLSAMLLSHDASFIWSCINPTDSRPVDPTDLSWGDELPSWSAFQAWPSLVVHR